MNVTTELRPRVNSTQAFALALECVTEALWQAPPHASTEQFEATVWRLAALSEAAASSTLPDVVKRVRDREIRRLLRELSAVKW